MLVLLTDGRLCLPNRTEKYCGCFVLQKLWTEDTLQNTVETLTTRTYLDIK